MSTELLLKESPTNTELITSRLTEVFETQYNPNLPEYLQKNICGITSLHMGISLLTDLEPESLVDTVVKYIDQSRYDISAVAVKTEINGKELLVPVTFTLDNDSESIARMESQAVQILSRNSNKPNTEPLVIMDRVEKPVFGFSLYRGFDHRGIPEYLKRNDIQLDHELFAGNFEEFKDRFLELKSRDPKTAALFSVNHLGLGVPLVYGSLNKNSITSHVVLLSDIFTISDQSTEQFVVFADPYMLDKNDGVVVTSLQRLGDVFTGKASILSSSAI